ncbi:MAG: hypothetical protein ABI349_09525, partial [Casimicrobiaceae bacterium]
GALRGITGARHRPKLHHEPQRRRCLFQRLPQRHKRPARSSSADAMAVLNEAKGKHPERVFSYKGRPLGQVNTRSWRNASKRAGIEKFGWHDLRHV